MPALRLALALALAAAGLNATTALASPTDPKPGAEYTLLASPQPSQTAGRKVEVTEFFMYHCPHCHALEPILEQWVQKEGNNIVFKRIHMPYQGANDPEAHLFLTLQAMGKNEAYQASIMDSVGNIVQRKRSETLTEQEVLDLAAKLPGLDMARFKDTWNSFGVKTALSRGPGIVFNNYKINTVPTLIVDGKYVVSPAQVAEATHAQDERQLFQQTLQVTEALVAKVQKSK